MIDNYIFIDNSINKKKENFMFPYIRSATILNTNTATNKIPVHLINLNATLIPK